MKTSKKEACAKSEFQWLIWTIFALENWFVFYD